MTVSELMAKLRTIDGCMEVNTLVWDIYIQNHYDLSIIDIKVVKDNILSPYVRLLTEDDL